MSVKLWNVFSHFVFTLAFLFLNKNFERAAMDCSSHLWHGGTHANQYIFEVLVQYRKLSDNLLAGQWHGGNSAPQISSKPKRHRKYLRIKTWQELNDSDGCPTWTRMALKTVSRRPLQLTSLSLVMYEQHLSCTLHFNWDLLLTRFVQHGQRTLQRKQWRSCLPWSTIVENRDLKLPTLPDMNKTLMNGISTRNDSTKRFQRCTSVVPWQGKNTSATVSWYHQSVSQ